MSKTATDVLIIGGGPAGNSAAITLAQADVRTVVCEAGTYPREKVCGEFLSPECMELLAKLGLDALLVDRGAHCIEAVTLTAPTGATWNTHLPGRAWGLSRRLLDSALAQRAAQAGAHIREATTVSHVAGSLAQGFEVEVRTTAGHSEIIDARAVIAAYGKRSALDRKWGRDFVDRAESFVAVKSHFHGPGLANCVALHTFPGGYCGLAEIEGDLTNVSLLVRARTFRRLVQHAAPGLESFIHWMRSQNAYLDDWLAQAERAEADWHSIGQVSFAPKQLGVNEVLMVGDTAGLIAPLVGDGIAMALQSGIMAGKKCADYLAGNSLARHLTQRYAADWHGEFGRRVKLARLAQACLLRPPLCALGIVLLRAMPPLGKQLIRNTRTLHLKEAAV